MLHWIIHFVGSLSYLGVGLLMALENVILVIPSELIMPLAGFSASRGHMTLWGAIAAGAAGSALGAVPVYALARVVGEERLMRWIQKHGKWLLLRKRDLQRADARFKRHGKFAVFITQLLPGIRGLIAIPAGFARMNVWLFAILNFAGTVIWCAGLAVGGWALGANYRKIEQYVSPIGWGILGLIIIAAVVWWMRRRRSAHRKQQAQGGGSPVARG
jgi:membrane protein DedA with SNARE-associated domain